MAGRHRIIVAALVSQAACSTATPRGERHVEHTASAVVVRATPDSATAVSPANPPREPAPLEKGLLPAGLCWFHPYLDSACSDYEKPHFAVVLAEFEVRPNGRDRLYLGDLPARPMPSLAAAERALQAARANGKFKPGYPFVASYDDLRRLDQKRHSVAVVAGLFAERAEADNYVRDLQLEGATIVELAPESWLPCESELWEQCEAQHVVAVEVAAKSVAFSDAQVASFDKKLSEENSADPDELAQQRRALEAAAAPICEVTRGQVFGATSLELYGASRVYAPVTCPDGRRAWVPWRNTRVESVVVQTKAGAMTSQVISVECDTPTLDERPFVEGEAPAPPPAPASVGCRG
ncbi:MAG: hypothetical protein U0271_34890 [Polyangiaceae bacterium]